MCDDHVASTVTRNTRVSLVSNVKYLQHSGNPIPAQRGGLGYLPLLRLRESSVALRDLVIGIR